MVTGPVGGAVEAIGATPGVGDFFDPFEATQDRAFAQGFANDVVRVLQNSPRFVDKERQDVKNELGLDPKLFDTTNAYMGRLIAVDDQLQERLTDAVKTLSNRGRIGVEDAKRAQTMINDIVNIRERMGLPPRVNNVAELRKKIADQVLKPGDPFIDQNGRLLWVNSETQQ